MKTLLIADLHLEERRPDILDIFLRFLREEATQAKALYILGDLFEAWIGDDDKSCFNQRVLKALCQTREQGTALYFMRGNRDFLIGKDFQRQSGCQLLPDEHCLLVNDEPLLLMHGDTLCTQDMEYLKFRRWSRRFWVQKLFLFKSLEKRRALAQNARKKSEKYTRDTQPAIMDVTQAEVERVMRKHQVRHLIHGHTHRPAVHHFQLDETSASRTVLAPWHEKGSALVCHDSGEQEVLELT